MVRTHSKMRFRFHAQGHPSVLSTHEMTIEITKETDLSPRGDCVVAVGSSMGARDLPNDLKFSISRSEAKARVVLSTGPFSFVIRGRGDSRLTLSHPTDLVIRRSGFISDRTLMIHSDKSANDLPREMVRLLQDPTTTVSIEISTSSED